MSRADEVMKSAMDRYAVVIAWSPPRTTPVTLSSVIVDGKVVGRRDVAHWDSPAIAPLPAPTDGRFKIDVAFRPDVRLDEAVVAVANLATGRFTVVKHLTAGLDASSSQHVTEVTVVAP